MARAIGGARAQARRDLIADMRGRTSPVTFAEACNRNADELDDRVAVVDRRQRFDWGAVKTISDRLALQLLERGVMRPDVALVHLPNVAEQFLLRLACEKAGVRVVLTSTWFREAELFPIVAHTRPKIAFVTGRAAAAGEYDGLVRRLAERGIELDFVVVGDGCPDWAESYDGFLAAAPATPSDGLLERTRFRFEERFYLPTTSGSTSAPKVTDMIFGQRIWLSLEHAAGAGLGVGETIAALAPITTGTSDSLVHHAAPYFAATVVLEPRFDAVATCELLVREGVHVAVAVPTMLSRMFATGAIDQLKDAPFRCFATYASAIGFELACAIEARAACRIIRCYGTMDYGGITMSRYDDSPEVRLKSVGRPIAGNDIRIVDEAGRECASGTEGEIVIRPGKYATGGYYRDPARTAEAWEGEFYRLGDLGVIDADGNVSLVGRSKDLIIRGGQNIVPAEIEELLSSHPMIVDSVVIGIPDEEMGERLCACVILGDGAALELAELRDHFEALKVARYKCPERIAVVEDFPMTHSGIKVDRRRLAEIVAGG